MEKIKTRSISTFDAEACAKAEGKTCHCRCGGALHGQPHFEFIRAEKVYMKSQRGKGKKFITKQAYARFLNKFVKGKGKA